MPDATYDAIIIGAGPHGRRGGLAKKPDTPDAPYEAIITGAGHNGMALGAYLARSGWDVAIFEKRGEEGGGLCTEELTRPGFLHNVHTHYHPTGGGCPVYDHLELTEKHCLRYGRPPVPM